MISSRLVLAVDTCSACPGAALADASGVLVSRHLDRDRARAESVGALVANLLAEIGAQAADLQGFGVVKGPGSYTGLRVGLALVSGLALLDSLELVAVTSLELAALSAAVDEGDLCVVLEAGRGNFYAAGYRKSVDGVVVETVPIHVASGNDLASRFEGERRHWVVCHESGTPAAQEWASGYAEFPCERSTVLARLAVAGLDAGRGQPCQSVIPVYAGSASFRRNLSKVLVGPDAPN